MGPDLMRRIAAPMIGAIFTSFLMELPVYPVIYEIWKERELARALDRRRRDSAAPGPLSRSFA